MKKDDKVVFNYEGSNIIVDLIECKNSIYTVIDVSTTIYNKEIVKLDKYFSKATKSTNCL